jgi:c-di-GMP-binding flagellar brake protein YcgR
MKEKRQHTRFIIEDMDIQCRMLFATEVKITNISLNGASLILNKKLNIGNRYILHIQSKDRDIKLKGSVIWEKIAKLKRNERGENVPIYEVGLRFDDVMAEKGVKLIDFIESNVITKNLKARLSGLRVNIIEPEKTTLFGYDKNFIVLRLGSGGMLIETEHLMNIDLKYSMEISFPEGEQSIKFLGRIASCLEIPDTSPKRYDVGIEFIEISAKDRSKLKEFIDFLQSL